MVLKGNDYVKRIRSTLRRIRSTLLRTEVCFKRSQVPRFMLNETKCTMSLKLQNRTQWAPFPWCQHLIYPQLPIWKVKHIKEVSHLQMSPHTHIRTPKRRPFHKQNTLLLQEKATQATLRGYMAAKQKSFVNSQLFPVNSG